MAVALVAAACGGSGSTYPAHASEVIAKLQASGLPLRHVTTVTEATDSNHLLGRPHQYIERIEWTDPRVNADDKAQGGVSAGGAVELFQSKDDAKRRQKYIETAEQAFPIVGTEWHFLVGRALVRISGSLPHSQEGGYEAALGVKTHPSGAAG